MAEVIKNGNNGDTLKINPNGAAQTFSVTESEKRQATTKGNDYNINTGEIALTGTATNALMYFKNDEDSDFVVTAIALGVSDRTATVSDSCVVTVIRNPTGGDIISDATAVAMNSNANFGSNKTLKSTTLAYSGKTAGTITGGSDHAILYTGNGRLFASLDMDMPKGSSVGVTIDLNTSGGANVYCALIGYVKDPNNNGGK